MQTYTERVVDLRRLHAAGAELLRSYPEGDSVLSPFAPFAAALREGRKVEVLVRYGHPPAVVFGWVWKDRATGTVLCQCWQGAETRQTGLARDSRVPFGWGLAVRLIAALADGERPAARDLVSFTPRSIHADILSAAKREAAAV